MKLAVPTHRRRGYQAILLAALVSGLLGTAPATQKVYLKLEGSQIASDHLAENWDSWIAALAFGKSLKHAASPAEAAGGARSVPQIKRSFDVVRPLDKATPLLAQAALKGEVFPKLIVLWIREREGATEDRVRIELENVRIASVKLSGGQHAGLRPTERIEDSMTQDVAFVFDNATFLYGQAAEEASPNEPSSEENPAPRAEGGLALFDPKNGPDSDGDGLPDPFEEAHGLDAHVDDRDLDSDGLTNGEEFAGGSAPDDRRSRFGIDRIQLMSQKPGQGLARFQSMPGRKYRLLGSPTGQHWFELTSFDIPEDGEAALQEIEMSFSGLTQLLRVEAIVLKDEDAAVN